MPVIVRDLDDDAAIILMVDANLQRETILPSERAYAYKMKLDAMRHQAGRPSEKNYSQVGNNFGKTSSEEMAEELGTIKNQIFRYIRLTELIPEILDMVDNGQIKFNPAVELSYLAREEQQDFFQQWTTPRLLLLFHRRRESKNSHRRESVLWTLCARL